MDSLKKQTKPLRRKSKKPSESRKKPKKLISLDSLIEEEFGKKGSAKRERFEAGYNEFLAGHLLQEARIKKGLTQEELAQKCGTNKGYISKIENNLKEVRISTLQRIVETGLGGKLKLSIQF